MAPGRLAFLRSYLYMSPLSAYTLRVDRGSGSPSGLSLAFVLYKNSKKINKTWVLCKMTAVVKVRKPSLSSPVVEYMDWF